MIMLKGLLPLILATPGIAWWDVNAPLSYGSPESVGLLSAPLKELQKNTSAYTVAQNYSSASYNLVHPLYPGATVLVGHRNTIVSHFSTGYNLLYSDSNGTKLAKNDRIRMRDDSIYDMASLSKMFTTVLALQQLGEGLINLNDTVDTYLPDFARNNKTSITILQLMTHTSGFDADPAPPLYPNYTTYEARREAVITQKPINPPGEVYLYSDLNFMNLAFVLEATTNSTLDQLMYDKFLHPLGMWDSFYNKGNLPANETEQYDRTVATEFQIEVLGTTYEPPRPQPVRGTVHDENAWALDGVSGHAGMFSTAYDLAIFCQTILNNGTYNGVKILEPWTVDLIFHNYNTKFPNDAHGLGFELNQTYWSGPMRSLQTAGHTGFTGTTMVIDRPSGTFWLALTNRVHPSRKWSSTNIEREYAGYFIAEALGRSPTGPTA
ncbi:hypothetical protein JCM24511_06564 [Saitozyma sp. JCM 24511]|nr:hypothetical protein JCM24511_06564 [Saitozyma sp. JCM 24511]